MDPAWPLDEVALLNHKLESTVRRLQRQSFVMDQVSAERSASTACGRIFRNIVSGRKETCMRPGRTELDRFSGKSMTTRCTASGVKIRKQSIVDETISQISKRANWDSERGQARTYHLYGETLIEILTRTSKSSCDFRLLVRVIYFVNYLKRTLSHNYLDWLFSFELNIDRQYADSNFLINADPVSFIRFWYDAFARQHIPRSHDWMSGKGQFTRWRKDSQTTKNLRRRHFLSFVLLSILEVSWLQHKYCFREIHLPGNVHHLFIGEPFRFRKYCEWIPGKSTISKHVDLNKSISRHNEAFLVPELHT